MRFNVPSKTLYTYTSAVSKVINSKNPLTILGSFLFELEDSTLTITGSDVENALIAKIEVLDASGEGRFCLDAKSIVDLLKEIPDQPLTVEIDDSTLEVVIRYPLGKYNMVALPGDQYPSYEGDKSGEEPRTFVIPAVQLAKGIENTLFAIGTDDFHPQMMGICIDIKPDDITFVATDTRKMVRYINALVHPGIEMRCILPAKPSNILKAILPKEEEEMVTVTLTSQSASFTFGAFTFNCRFIKGKYPEYNRVIPANNPYTLRVDRVRFLNAVRRVGVFVDPGYGMEKFKITEDHILLKASDTSLMSAADGQIDCEYHGPELVMGFSAPYVIEICNTLQTEEILLHLSDPGRPGVFCPTSNDEGTDLLMLLMPMNVVEF